MAAVSINQGKLASLVRTTRNNKGRRFFYYAVEKFGKTTLAAAAPHSLIIGPEDGLPESLASHPHIVPKDWAHLKEICRMLATEEHGYQNVALDTVDWIEPMVWAYVCAVNKWANIEAAGYGKGYIAARDEWRDLLAILEQGREVGITWWLLGHAVVKTVKNPEGADFDKYVPSLNEKTAALLKQWCDAVVFGNYKTLVDVDEKTKRAKGIGGKARVIYTTRSAAYDAGNRYGLPETLPADYAALAAALTGEGTAERCARLTAEIIKALDDLGDATIKEKTIAWLPANRTNLNALSETANKLATKIQQKQENGQ